MGSHTGIGVFLMADEGVDKDVCNEKHHALNGWIRRLEKQTDGLGKKVDSIIWLLVGNLAGIVTLLVKGFI